jgi:hypothetical protein
MSDQNQKPLSDERMRRRAFSRWENEGGAPASGREQHPVKKASYTVVYKKHPVIEKHIKTPEEEKLCV